MTVKRLSEIIDIRTTIYVLTTVAVVFSGWFGQKERLSAVEYKVEHNCDVILEQKEYLREMQKNMSNLAETVVEIKTMLKMAMENKQKH